VGSDLARSLSSAFTVIHEYPAAVVQDQDGPPVAFRHVKSDPSLEGDSSPSTTADRDARHAAVVRSLHSPRSRPKRSCGRRSPLWHRLRIIPSVPPDRTAARRRCPGIVGHVAAPPFRGTILATCWMTFGHVRRPRSPGHAKCNAKPLSQHDFSRAINNLKFAL
jgi:hypothetical protein